ncbi:MAG: phytanoyl-CoA dioxygenase family protein [Planctomycetota bacterium]|nr:phytanoyl-CoA dioxygenase family protein [Planctomycetota bacterium]
MPQPAPLTTPDNLPASLVEDYRRDGFVRVPCVLSPAEAAEFRAATLACDQRLRSLTAGSAAEKVFSQLLNVWREDPVIRRLTLHPRLGGIAQKLAGVKLRLWHDHTLIKQPHNRANTEFHQDRPYWPLLDADHPLSAWIALQDVPVERGCMSFIPGSHRVTNLVSQDLMDPRDLFRKCPELAYYPRVTVPLRAGDVTFHHAYAAHMATSNQTDEARVAHVVIFMDAGARYRKRADGAVHPVTDPLNLPDGARLDQELFPLVDGFGEGKKA